MKLKNGHKRPNIKKMRVLEGTGTWHMAHKAMTVHEGTKLYLRVLWVLEGTKGYTKSSRVFEGT